MEEVTAIEAIAALFTNRQFEECLTFVEIAQQSNKITLNQAKVFKAGCWIHLKTNQEESMKSLHEVIQEEPTNAFAYFEIGVSYYLTGRFNEAISQFEYSKALHNSMLVSSNVYISYCKKILETFAESETTFNNGDYVGAMRILKKALEIDEFNESVKKVADEIFASFISRVISNLENKTLGPDENQNLTIEATDQLSEIEKMILADNFVEAEQLLPAEGTSHTSQQCYLKGLLRYRYGEAARGNWYFNKALEIDPGHFKAREMAEKSKMLLKMMKDATDDMAAQRYQIAIEKLTGALEIDPSNLRIVQGIYFQRCVCKFQQGNQDAAFKDFLEHEKLELQTGLMKGDKQLRADKSNSIQSE